jgi:hypothetical protein
MAQKKAKESNWQCDSRPLKVGNCSDSFMCKWLITYLWKALDQRYNFVLDLTLIKGLHTKLWASKVVRVPILGISRLQLGSPETKWHLRVGPMARHREYSKGEGGGASPQVWSVLNLVSLCLPVVRLCIKNAPTTH